MEILLVEDNLDDARVTMDALRTGQVRCRVTLVCDGEEAMRFLRHESVFAQAPRPDLILLDMELPKKDGHEVLVEIRADEELRSIPVVVLTASLVHRTILQHERLEVDAFMTKPVSFQQFITVIQSIRRSWLTEFVLATAGH
jgi:CheY-like chemotaxis protein